MLFCVQIALITPFVFVLLYVVMNYVVKGEGSVCIVVLGDIGRSPRMQYHALSLAESGFSVNVVGYGGSTPHKAVTDNDNIEINIIHEAPRLMNYFPGPLSYIARAMWLFAFLTFTLLLLPKSRYYFVQNPPSIPSLPVVVLVCWLRGSNLVIDWHNYGHTMLALKLGPHHPLVSCSHRIERILVRQAVANICVTMAMKEDLSHHWGIRATTVYDRPPEMFRTISLSEQHALFTRLAKQYPVFRASPTKDNSTVFTECGSDCNTIRLHDRPVLLVSSTSWTEEEDFGLLLDALEKYEKNTADSAPRILCVITGKGPQKEMYQTQIEALSWNKVHFCLPWLTAEDYPLLLGAADIGVCLHKSSSGLDLPMKVVDMFGCGLPVCAIRYNCVEELIKPSINGLLFDDSHQLAQQLQELLSAFPDQSDKLSMFRENLKQFQALRWHSQWVSLVLPIFRVKPQ